MNTKDRLWSLGAGLVAVGIAAGAWFGTISPDLAAASVARSDLETVEHQNSLHALRIVTLGEAAAQMDQFEASRSELAQALPAELQYADFMRQLDALAAETGVSIVGVVSTEAMPYTPPAEVAEAPAAEEAPAEGEAAAEGEAVAETASVAAEGEAPAGPLPYVDPTIGPDNLSAVSFTVSATGGSAELETFMHRLQMGQRLVSVGAASLALDAGAQTGLDGGPVEGEGGGWRAEISGYLYVLQPTSTRP